MSIEDELAIRQAIARYSYTFDSGDCDGWAAVFTEDAVWEYYGIGDTEPQTRLEGHDALRGFAQQRKDERPGDVRSYHHQSGILFDELTPESARTRVMVIITVQKAGAASATVYLTGVYHDEWRKTQDGWRLAYRALKA